MLDTGESVGERGKEKSPGWSASGVLSTPDASGVTPGRSVSLQQEFEEAGVYTLQFDLILPTPAPTVKQARATAVIQWTVAGNTVTRVVAVASGMSISGVAKSIRVTITDTTIDNAGQDGYDYRVSFTIAPGTRAFSAAPPLGEQMLTTQVATGVGLAVDIPLGAGINAVSVIIGDVLTGAVAQNLAYKDITIGQNDGAFNVLGQWKPPPFGPQWVPLLPGARTLTVDVLLAGSLAVITIIWGLDG
jgi:hypothetical protein